MSRPGKKKKKEKKARRGRACAGPLGLHCVHLVERQARPGENQDGVPHPPTAPVLPRGDVETWLRLFPHNVLRSRPPGRIGASVVRGDKTFFSGVVWSAAQNPAILRPRLRPRLALSSRSGHCMHHDDAWPRSQFVGIQARHRGGGGLACSTAAMATQSRHETVRFGPTRSRAPPRRTDSGGHRRCGASHAATPPLWASFSNEVGTLDRHSAQSGPSIRCFNDEAGQAAVCIDLARDARQNLHGTCSHRIL